MTQVLHRDISPWQAEFTKAQVLPPEYISHIGRVLSNTLMQQSLHRIGASQPSVLGVYGAQGSGKSTLAAYIAKRHEHSGFGKCVVLSIDDFYLPQRQRKALARDIHPLFVTRGVPGTHDVSLLQTTLDQLIQFDAPVAIPRFDKLADERVPEREFVEIDVAPSLIILEGWCIGARPQSEAELVTPVNSLERTEDSDGVWRRYVNSQLATEYLPVWTRLNELWGLVAPGFEVVQDWRMEQEIKLGEQTGRDTMTVAQIRRFIQHYERLTRSSLTQIHEMADVCLHLDVQRTITRVVGGKRVHYEY